MQKRGEKKEWAEVPEILSSAPSPVASSQSYVVPELYITGYPTTRTLPHLRTLWFLGPHVLGTLQLGYSLPSDLYGPWVS